MPLPRVLSSKVLQLTVALFLLSTTHDAHAADAKSQGANSCAKFGSAYEGATSDLITLRGYRLAVAGLLDLEDFRQLDCVADSIRGSKARFAGGFWQLRSFYRGLSEIPGHATEEDWQARIAHLQHWTSANPNSITARVALAEAYINFAWHARGDGFNGSVTDSGWKLFRQRIDQARATLDDASSLSPKCPEWYSAMQSVAKGQGWDLQKSDDLLKQATAFAPDYYYYYRSLADYKLPKWEGQDGDASNFANESADRVGGLRGDILYFQIGAAIVCACDEPEFNRMSWPRLQKGYEALEKEYGSSVSNINSFALMATKNEDSVAADVAFKRISDNFEIETWVTEDFFNQMKTWAAQFAPLEARSRGLEREASANALAPTGPPYRKSVEQALGTIVQQCAKGSEDETKFEFMLQVGADGIAKDAWMRHPTVVGNCVLKNIYDSNVKKEALFAPPPKADYWMKLALDPSVSVATK